MKENRNETNEIEDQKKQRKNRSENKVSCWDGLIPDRPPARIDVGCKDKLHIDDIRIDEEQQ